MLKLILIVFITLSSTVFAGEIFVKDAKEFKATVNYNNKDVKNSKIIIKAVPKKGWHINDGFPISFKPKTTCLEFEKKKYKKKDAKTITHKELLFSIPTKCNEKGKKELDATIVLGVCTDTICKRVEFKVLSPLEIKETKIKKTEPNKIDIKK